MSDYPEAWNVNYGPTQPLQIAPPAPFGIEDDGHYRFPLWTERYTGFKQQVVVYPAGLVTHVGAPALKVAIRKTQDIAVKLRDGVTIYVDVLRAADTPLDTKLPTILAWSPYGKTTPKNHAFQHWIAQLPVDKVSGLAVTEGPDPNFWAANGYNVVHVDPRGINMSEGKMAWWGSVNANDGYDVIQWIADQSWSNGKVGMSGVSWLGVSQYFVAATNPPALAAISPRSHTHDCYRSFYIMNGGIISTTPFFKELHDGLMGNNSLMERFDEMAVEQPLMTPYWDDKRARVEKIQAAVLAIGGFGAFGNTSDAILTIPEGRKWLRYLANYHLADYYSDESLAREKKFMDRYLKGTDNGWERDTPKVVVEIMEPGVGTGVAQLRTSDKWPYDGTSYRKLYLDPANNALQTTAPGAAAIASYDAMTGQKAFTYTFTEDTNIVGFMKGKFWVASNGADDMDLFVKLEKLKGAAVLPVTLNASRQRVSLRSLDVALSTDYKPVHSFLKNEYLGEGEVVPVEVNLQTHSQVFRAGESLRVTIAGNMLAAGTFGVASGLRNTGLHIIHAGAERSSFIQIPVIPIA